VEVFLRGRAAHPHRDPLLRPRHVLLDGPGGHGLVLHEDTFSAVVQVQGGRVIRDGDEADDWHGIVDLEIVVSA
jgi:hypothetical protein